MIPSRVLEEALDCVLGRVRWYVTRRHVIPEATKRSFNYLCDVLNKPHEAPWTRIK
jgi:hypothetical protein